MKRIGVTGNNGFIGRHLCNWIRFIKSDEFEIIDFQKDYFNKSDMLDKFVKQCDVIIHLAGVNRAPTDDIVLKTNLELAELLVSSLYRTNSSAHVIMSSTIQEGNESVYGKSKKLSREKLASWSVNSDGIFSGMIIPNVFGPFCKPHYNSFISTFSYDLVNYKDPIIIQDKEIELIYIDDLIKEILDIILANKEVAAYRIKGTEKVKVSEVLDHLKRFKSSYFDYGEMPSLRNQFETNIFNTFRSYIQMDNFFPYRYNENSDHRGSFIELLRDSSGGQSSFSTSFPNVIRGNHFHTRKIERFSILRGTARIKIRNIETNKTLEYILSDDAPSFIDIPIWHTHSLENIGEKELLMYFWINEFYDSTDPDTYVLNV